MKRIFIILSGLLVLVLFQNCSSAFESVSEYGATGSLSDSLDNDEALASLSKPIIRSHFSQFLDESAQQQGIYALSCKSKNEELIENIPSKLTSLEINNTLNNILNIDAEALSNYPYQDTVNAFEESNTFKIDENKTFFTSISSVADIAAQKFIGSLEAKTNKNFNCDFTKSCLDKISAVLPVYLWRKPLSAVESDQIKNLVGDPTTEVQVKSSLYSLVSYLIQSPQFFIKNLTLTTAAELTTLNLYDYASRLSFFALSAGPSLDILNKIIAGDLSDHSNISAYIKNQLNDDVYQRQFVKKFFGRWFGFDDSIDINEIDTDLNYNIADISNEQMDLFVQLYKADAPLSDIINPAERKNSYLASKYFEYTTKSDDEFRSMVKKGVQIVENINCYTLGEVTQNTDRAINEVLEDEDFPTNGTIIAKQEFHRARADCNYCHQHIDPAASGLLWMGQFGAEKTTFADGRPIELTASLGGQSYNKLSEYLSLLSNTADFEACFAEKIHKKMMPTSTLSPSKNIRPCLINDIMGASTQNLGMKTIVNNAIGSYTFKTVKRPTQYFKD